MSIVVAGAGIGGLTAALCLAQIGRSITVCERASVIEEVGAGLQCGANAMRVFDQLGCRRKSKRFRWIQITSIFCITELEKFFIVWS